MQTRASAEKQYAEFYSLWVADFRKDTSLYLDLAAKYAGPVLEIGCGTGRVLARLGEAGYEALGVDVARPMLEVARRTIQPWRDRVRIADFDFRSNALFEKFNVVIASLYAFNHLIDVAEQRLFLRHVARCMKSPSVLAIDFFCPLPMIRPETNGRWREIERTVPSRWSRSRTGASCPPSKPSSFWSRPASRAFASCRTTTCRARVGSARASGRSGPIS